jgi:hypothetical protein
LASVAVTTNEAVLRVVGVPAIRPAPFIDNPAGRAPLVIVNAYEPAPPLAVNCWLNDDPTVAVKDVGEIVMVALQVMTRLKAFDPVQPLLSVTCTVKLKVPACGVPESTPPEESVIPPGSAPLVFV